jgi:hypothetical protein
MRPAPISLGSNANMVLLLPTTPNSVGRRCAASRSLVAKSEGNCAQQRLAPTFHSSITSAMRRSSSGMNTVKDSGSDAIRKDLDYFRMLALKITIEQPGPLERPMQILTA